MSIKIKPSDVIQWGTSGKTNTVSYIDPSGRFAEVEFNEPIPFYDEEDHSKRILLSRLTRMIRDGMATVIPKKEPFMWEHQFKTEPELFMFGERMSFDDEHRRVSLTIDTGFIRFRDDRIVNVTVKIEEVV